MNDDNFYNESPNKICDDCGMTFDMCECNDDNKN